jgi:hypothetical protein
MHTIVKSPAVESTRLSPNGLTSRNRRQQPYNFRSGIVFVNTNSSLRNVDNHVHAQYKIKRKAETRAE